MALLKRLVTVAVALLVSTFLLAAPEAEKKVEKKTEKTAAADAHAPMHAVCVMAPTKDSKVHGVIKFTQTDKGVEITGTLTGLTPGEHGFHVHEFGDVSSEDGMATGGHFDSDKHMHGAEDANERHTGDLGNVTADENGQAKINKTDKVISLHGANSVIGRGLIVHAKADDLKTQPTGNAGGRAAQGVIGVAK